MMRAAQEGCSSCCAGMQYAQPSMLLMHYMLPRPTVLHQELWLASRMLQEVAHPQGRVAPHNVSQSLHGKDLSVFDMVNV